MVTETRQTRRQVAAQREAAAPPVTERTIAALGHTDLDQPDRVQGEEPLAPMQEQGMVGIAEVKNPGKMTLYKRVPYGWKPTIVNVGAVEACLRSGNFLMECGDCGGHCGLDPNSCPERKPIAFRRCPVCGRKVFDVNEDEDLDAAEPEPGEIRDDLYKTMTPQQRTKVKLDSHLVQFHPDYAQANGLTVAAPRPYDVTPVSALDEARGIGTPVPQPVVAKSEG